MNSRELRARIHRVVLPGLARRKNLRPHSGMVILDLMAPAVL
jgi:hypothetical protein